MRQRNISTTDVEKVFEKPDISYPSKPNSNRTVH
ncbi:hypothetical protein [Corynebacterium aquilae]